MTHEESWNEFIDELRAYVQEHHHEFDRLTTGFLNKHTNLLSKVKYTRKKINDGTLEEWMVRLLRPAQEPAHQPRADSGGGEYERYGGALRGKTWFDFAHQNKLRDYRFELID